MSLPDDTTPEPVANPAAEATEERHLFAVPDETDAETTGQIDPIPAEPTKAEPSARTQWLASAFKPRSGLYTERATAPRDVIRRARHGGQLADAGVLRTAARAYSYYQAAGKITLRTLDWLLFDNTARTLLIALLAGLTWLLIAQL